MLCRFIWYRGCCPFGTLSAGLKSIRIKSGCSLSLILSLLSCNYYRLSKRIKLSRGCRIRGLCLNGPGWVCFSRCFGCWVRRRNWAGWCLFRLIACSWRNISLGEDLRRSRGVEIWVFLWNIPLGSWRVACRCWGWFIWWLFAPNSAFLSCQKFLKVWSVLLNFLSI